MDQALIKVNQVSRTFGKLLALDSISFTVNKGEVLGLLGPNGAGKTTALRILCGDLAPTAGRILINDIDIQSHPIEAKKHLGFLPETPPLYRELTVDEYLRACGRLHGIKRRQLLAAVDQVKQRCSLTDVGKRIIGQLALGYRQRIGLAQAVIHNPDVIVLDEPTTGLDPNQIAEIRELLQNLSTDHGIVLTTQMFSEVLNICHRIHIIHRGRIVLSETLGGLEKRMQTHTWRLHCEHRPSLERLLKLDEVDHAVLINDHQCRIHFTGDVTELPVAALQNLLQTALQEQWQLTELVAEKRSLESIFSDITGPQHEKYLDSGAA